MNRAQKEAWFGLFLGVPLVLIPGGVFILISYDKGASIAPPFMLAYLASMSFLPWLIRHFAYRNKKQVNYDERDRLIEKRAALISYFFFWLYFVISLIIPWWVAGSEGSVPAVILPIILTGGLSIFVFIQSLTTLILYGNDNKLSEGGAA
ncbi:MAG: hypothetical protein ISS71_10110 [Phycisphaerae bacterium]|nr:hypothetical protein [Phycisphaerae bacterium]